MTEQYINFGETTLAEALDASETGIDVTDGSVFPAIGDFRVVVDDEIMLATARSSNTLTVTRGAEGTTAATHSSGADIKAMLTEAGLLAIIEQNAIQQGATEPTVQAGAWYDPTGDDAIEALGVETVRAELSADVTLTNHSTWYDGPSVALPAGKWLVDWKALLQSGGSSNVSSNFRLVDAAVAVIYDEQENTQHSANGYRWATSGFAYVDLSTLTTIKLQVMRDNSVSCTLKRDGGNSVQHYPTRIVAYKLGSGNVSGLDAARAKRTSGNITLNSTSWANVDTGIDLVVPAQAGDVLLIAISAFLGTEAVWMALDVATIVSGSPVNYITGGGGASDQGIAALLTNASAVYAKGGASIQYVVQSGDISAGNVTLRLRYRNTSGAGNRTLHATVDIPLQWSVVNLRGGAASRDIGYEFAYVEYTGGLTVTATSEATGQSVVSAGAVVFDGLTKVCIEFFAPQLSTTDILIIDLSDGGTEIGRMGVFGESINRDATLLRRFLTPSAGSHTYAIQAWKVAGTASVDGGAGGSGNRMPGYIRVTKA